MKKLVLPVLLAAVCCGLLVWALGQRDALPGRPLPEFVDGGSSYSAFFSRFYDEVPVRVDCQHRQNGTVQRWQTVDPTAISCLFEAVKGLRVSGAAPGSSDLTEDTLVFTMPDRTQYTFRFQAGALVWQDGIWQVSGFDDLRAAVKEYLVDQPKGVDAARSASGKAPA